MISQNFDVAVIGAGMGGLATAGLLARGGRSVILLDRASQAGGVCQAVAREGYRFEVGGSLLCGFHPGGSLSLLCERLGVRLPTQECDLTLQVALPRHRISLLKDPERWWAEVRREFPESEGGWHALWSELLALGAERDRALRELPPLPPHGWVERLRGWHLLTFGKLAPVPGQPGGGLKKAQATPFRATLLRHGLDSASQQVLDACLGYLLVRTADECSTLEAALAFYRVAQGVVTLSGGPAALVEALVEQFRRDGGQLRLETAVAECLLEHRRVTGVILKGGETIRARWVVADVPPDILAGAMLPPRRGWFRRRGPLDVPWHASRVAQAMVLAVPERMLPSELGGHCLLVPNADRPVREENLIFVHTAPAAEGAGEADGMRCLTVGRFMPPHAGADGEAAEAELIEALDQLVPGIQEAAAYRQWLSPAALAEVWGRPSAAVRYAADSHEWMGQRGVPHQVGWPGLLVAGGWTHPGRLLSDVVEGALRVADLITASA